MINDIRAVAAAAFQLPLEKVPASASNQNLPQWDSLGHINFVMALEKHFGVAFTLDEIIELHDLVTIEKVLAAKKGT